MGRGHVQLTAELLRTLLKLPKCHITNIEFEPKCEIITLHLVGEDFPNVAEGARSMLLSDSLWDSQHKGDS